jgi:methionyl-tRNA formyltransferase
MTMLKLWGLITQPDKPAGRDLEKKAVPVKKFIESAEWPGKLFTPTFIEKSRKYILNDTQPELIIVADYGQLLPEITINYPKYKCLNVHGSLLPDLRGAVPIPIAILKGYKITGISIPVMTVGLDDGPVVASRECEIAEIDNTLTLKKKLSELGAQALTEVIPDWVSGKITAVEQDDSKATFAGKELISKDNARFEKGFGAEVVDKMVRAFYPWPVAWCEVDFNGRKMRLKVYKAKLLDELISGDTGEIVKEGKSLVLKLEDGALELQELQLEGKKVGSAKDYLYLSGAKSI